jgi:hypothetical protein
VPFTVINDPIAQYPAWLEPDFGEELETGLIEVIDVAIQLMQIQKRETVSDKKLHRLGSITFTAL